MVKSVTTIWLDYGQISDKQCYMSFCKIDPYLVSFRDAKKCIDYIINLKINEDRVILIISTDKSSIISDTFIEQFTKLIQVEEIYLLCNSNKIENETFNHLRQVRGIYTERCALCNDLNSFMLINRRRREGYLRTDFIINVIAEATDTSATTAMPEHPLSMNASNTYGKQNELESMYSKLLRDVLLEDTKLSQNEIVAFFRETLAGNASELKYVNQFEEYYESKDAIHWFTRDIFLYRLLNRALREKDIITLYEMRYFIKDLYLKLKELFNTQLSCCSVFFTETTVYRGQLMNNLDFNQKIRNNIGGFFSLSSFMSTTRIRALALSYAGNNNSSNIRQEQSVLFEIPIDTSIVKFPYAEIWKESAFGEGEQEVLFTMGTIFRIISITEELEAGVWLVRLKLSDEEDEHFHKISPIIKKDITVTQKPLIKLIKIMCRMQYLREAEKLSLVALKDNSIASHWGSSALIYYLLGAICIATGKVDEAKVYLIKALNMAYENGIPQIDSSLSNLYTNLGTVYENLEQYDNALTYHNLALNVFANTKIVNQNDLAIKYSNIASVCRKRHEYIQSLNNYTNCWKIESEILPPDDIKLLITRNNIGIVFILQGNYSRAIEYFQEILVYGNTSVILSDTSILLAVIEWNMACAFYYKRQFIEALNWLRKCTSIVTSQLNVILNGFRARECKDWIQGIEQELLKEPCQVQKRYIPDPWPICHRYHLDGYLD